MSSKDDYIQELEEECFDYLAKVVELLDTYSLWNNDGEYIFKDGSKFGQFRPDQEDDTNE